MRNINAQTLAQLEGSELRAFFLLDLIIDGTELFYTDADVDIVPDARYQPIGFNIGGIAYSVGNIVDSVNIGIDGVDRVLLSLFMSGTPQGEAVRVRLIVVDDTGTVIGVPVTIFEGEIDSWSGDETAISITVTNIFVRWARHTLSKHPSKCRWKVFAGTLATLEEKQASECAYEGLETICNRSYDRCLELENTDNFGGFRFLPSIMEAEIWWGRLRPQEPSTTVGYHHSVSLPDVGGYDGVPDVGMPADGGDTSGGNEGPGAVT